MAKQQLYQVYCLAAGKDGEILFTAYPVDEIPSEKCLWKIEKPVRATSARGAVRKVNTRTKRAAAPKPFINPKEVK